MQITRETKIRLTLFLVFGIPVAAFLFFIGGVCFESVIGSFCSAVVALLCYEVLTKPQDELSKSRFHLAVVFYLALLVFLSTYCVMYIQDIDRAFFWSVSAALLFMTFFCWPILLWIDQTARRTVFQNKRTLFSNITTTTVTWVAICLIFKPIVPFGITVALAIEGLTGFSFGATMHVYAFLSLGTPMGPA